MIAESRLDTLLDGHASSKASNDQQAPSRSNGTSAPVGALDRSRRGRRQVCVVRSLHRQPDPLLGGRSGTKDVSDTSLIVRLRDLQRPICESYARWSTFRAARCSRWWSSSSLFFDST